MNWGLMGQLPNVPAGALETWLMCALVVCNMVIAVKAVARREPSDREFVTRDEFRGFKETMERELGRLRTLNEQHYLGLVEKLAKIEGGLERLDERTK